jgi:hypothetical protein
MLNFDTKTIPSPSRPKAYARALRTLSTILNYQTQYYLFLLARPENRTYPNYEFIQWVDQATVQFVENLDKIIDLILNYPSIRERITQIDFCLTYDTENLGLLVQEIVQQRWGDGTIRLFLTYYFARLLKCLIRGSDEDTRVMHGAAYVLFIMGTAWDEAAATRPLSPVLMMYILHWAGLILTKVISPQSILYNFLF